MIDRPIRPQFPKAVSERNASDRYGSFLRLTVDTDTLAMCGASAALHISNAPMQRPSRVFVFPASMEVW